MPRLAKLVCTALALSLASSGSAQTTVPKKPPVKKAPAPVKAAPKTPPPNQCDLKRSVQLNATSKQYLVVSTESPSPATAAAPAPAPEMSDAATQVQLAAMSGRGGRGGAPAKPKGGVIKER